MALRRYQMAATKSPLENQELGVKDLASKRTVSMAQLVPPYRLDQGRYGQVKFQPVPLLCVLLSQTKATIWLRLLLRNLQSSAPP